MAKGQCRSCHCCKTPIPVFFTRILAIVLLLGVPLIIAILSKIPPFSWVINMIAPNCNSCGHRMAYHSPKKSKSGSAKYPWVFI